MGWIEEKAREKAEYDAKVQTKAAKLHALNVPVQARVAAEWEVYKAFLETYMPIMEGFAHVLFAFQERAKRVDVIFDVRFEYLEIHGPENRKVRSTRTFDRDPEGYEEYTIKDKPGPETVKEPYLVISDRYASAKLSIVYPGKPYFHEYDGLKYLGMEKHQCLIEYDYKQQLPGGEDGYLTDQKLLRTISVDKVATRFEDICKWVTEMNWEGRQYDGFHPKEQAAKVALLAAKAPGAEPSWVYYRQMYDGQKKAKRQEQEFFKGLKFFSKPALITLAIIGLIWLVLPTLAIVLFVIFLILVIVAIGISIAAAADPL